MNHTPTSKHIMLELGFSALTTLPFLCWQSIKLARRLFSSISGLHPLGTSNTLHSPVLTTNVFIECCPSSFHGATETGTRKSASGVVIVPVSPPALCPQPATSHSHLTTELPWRKQVIGAVDIIGELELELRTALQELTTLVLEWCLL